MIDDLEFRQGFAVTVALEPRVQLVLLLDTSASMAGQRMIELNAGLRAFKAAFVSDSLPAMRVEVALATLCPAALRHDFAVAGHFSAPTLQASGSRAIGPAIHLALDRIAERMRDFSAQNVACYRPWIFLVTAGEPAAGDGVWREAAERVKELEAQKKAAFFSVGLDGADMGVLAQLSTRQPLKLKGLKFKEMFAWLASSLSRVAHSKPNEEVKLDSPMGWGSL